MIQGFRLSPQQEAVWLLAQADPATPYRCALVLEVRGVPDGAALESAVAASEARHEILRTTFRQPRGTDRAVQAVGKSDGPLAWVTLDLTGRPREEAAAELLATLERTPLDPDRPLRAARAAWGEDAFLLALELPALCCDLPGMRNLAAEIAAAFEGRGDGDGGDGGEEPLQYADLAEWLCGLLEADEAAARFEYWGRQDLSGLLAWKLPFERLPQGGSPFSPARAVLTLPEDLEAAVGRLATALEVSREAIFLAAWQTLLFRLVGQAQIVVGALADGRSYEGLESAVGLLCRHVPVAASLTGGDRFAATARRTARELAEAREWQEYFTWGPARKALGFAGRGSFFFPVTFAWRPAPPPLAAAGVRFTPLLERAVTDRFRLGLTVVESAAGLTLEVGFDACLVAGEDALRLAAQLSILLAAVAADPEAALDDPDLLTAAERGALIDERNATPYGQGTDGAPTVHALIARRAAETPEAPAIDAPDGRLTYGELLGRARHLAAHLRRLGLGRESRVGLFVDRSAAMAIGVLGILEAGAAYVPLDPAYPEERLAFLLADARIAALVSSRTLIDSLPAHGAPDVPIVPILSIEDVLSEPAQAGGAAEEPHPHDAAYVIYTSGSTGEPRGVVIEHGNLAHYARALAEPLGLTAADRFLHTASVAFSSSVRQLLVPLTRGATVVVAGEEERRDPLALLRRIAAAGVTVIDLVPSHWRSLTEAVRALPPANRREILDNRVRLVLSASEPLLSDLPRDFRLELGHPAELVNMFGQTETTGIVATYPIAPRAGEATAGVPIGRPLAATEIYILDGRLRPTPTGVTGRVFIGGRGLGRGYLGRPEATAARLVPHPFAGEPGARLYDTGDLARFRSDAMIEFLGRSDHQIKVRGRRVELGEIEAAIGQHPDVREAVVGAHEDKAGNPRLVGYVVPRRQPAPSADGLRVFLQEKLPEYMVPALWVFLDALPLSPNGKIDRAALPAPDPAKGAGDEAYLPPRDETEVRLAEIWSSLLGVERVGMHDNFFKLGGHSLLGTVLMSRVRDAFRIDLPVIRLFESPTLEGLAAVISERQTAAADLPPLAPRIAADVPAEAGEVDALSGDQVREMLERLLRDGEAAR